MMMDEREIAESITCNGKPISDDRIEEDIEGITELNLNGCGFQDIPKEVDDLPNLRSLMLNGNDICKIRKLSNNKALQNLELDDNCIHKIENVGRVVLPSLGVLQLSTNEIKKIEGLDGTQLYILNLAGNQITRIEGLDKLDGVLEGLDLSDNQISKIEGLDQVQKQLEGLNLKGNPIPRRECDAFSKQVGKKYRGTAEGYMDVVNC